MEQLLVSVFFPRSDNPRITFGKIIQFVLAFTATIGIVIGISKLFPHFFVIYIDPFGRVFGIFVFIILYYLCYGLETFLMKLRPPRKKRR